MNAKSSLESSFYNYSNNVEKSDKYSDSLPLNCNKNNLTKKSREFSSLTFEEIKVTENVPKINESKSSDKSLNRPRFHRRQLLVLITLAYGNFWIATCVSLQAPFFPKEAESKVVWVLKVRQGLKFKRLEDKDSLMSLKSYKIGATSTQYGLVFGIYELMICITSPLFGKLITCVSPNFLCEAGLFVSGVSTILFGLLDRAPDGIPFIALAFLIRIAEGIAAAAFMTASYTVMAKEFPDKIATTFSLLETCFGLGLILGPTLGGAIYEIGGFVMPFAILGIFLLLGGGVILIFMPNSGEITPLRSGNLIKFMSDPGMILDAIAIITSLNFIGFNAATLEPHLRQFDLSPVIIGCIFVISGGIYALTTPIWGKLCDKGCDPKILCLIGSILCSIGFIFIGPLHFIQIETKLWLIITSLAFIGLGIAAKLVTAFVSALHDSIRRRGFPDDISTYGLVSAMFFSSCSIGAFIGPSLGGFLLERVGYKKSVIVILIGDIFMILLVSVYLIFRKKFNSFNREKETLIRNGQKCYGLSQTSN